MVWNIFLLLVSPFELTTTYYIEFFPSPRLRFISLLNQLLTDIYGSARLFGIMITFHHRVLYLCTSPEYYLEPGNHIHSVGRAILGM